MQSCLFPPCVFQPLMAKNVFRNCWKMFSIDMEHVTGCTGVIYVFPSFSSAYFLSRRVRHLKPGRILPTDTNRRFELQRQYSYSVRFPGVWKHASQAWYLEFQYVRGRLFCLYVWKTYGSFVNRFLNDGGLLSRCSMTSQVLKATQIHTIKLINKQTNKQKQKQQNEWISD